MSVLMLTNENPESTKTYIRDYIFSKYDRAMSSVINDVDKDSTSYSLPDEYSKIIAVRDRNYDELEPLIEVDEGDNDSVAGSRARDIDDDIL